MLAHCYLALRRRDAENHTQHHKPGSFPVPSPGSSLTPVAGFPPPGRQSVADLRRAALEQLFIQVIEAAVRARDGP